VRVVKMKRHRNGEAGMRHAAEIKTAKKTKKHNYK
jgi:hypothetical protein